MKGVLIKWRRCTFSFFHREEWSSFISSLYFRLGTGHGRLDEYGEELRARSRRRCLGRSLGKAHLQVFENLLEQSKYDLYTLRMCLGVSDFPRCKRTDEWKDRADPLLEMRERNLNCWIPLLFRNRSMFFFSHFIQIYWVGPLLGGVTAGFVYDHVFAANSSKQKFRTCMLGAEYQVGDKKIKKWVDGWDVERSITPFFFIRTPFFSPRLDVLIFLVIWASDVPINVLNFFSIKVQ